MKRKILYILGAVLTISLIVGTVYYYLLTRKNSVSNNNIDATNVVINNTKLINASIAQVFDDNARYPSIEIDPVNNPIIYYYNEQNISSIFERKLTNDSVKQTLAEYEGLDNISWSYDHSKAIINVVYDKQNFKDNDNILSFDGAQDGFIYYWIYDIKNKKLSKLAENISSPIWSPYENKIIYLEQDTESRQLKIIDLTNNSVKTVLNITGDDLIKYDFLTKNKIYYQPQPFGIEGEDVLENSLYIINLDSMEKTQTDIAMIGQIVPAHKNGLFAIKSEINHQKIIVIYNENAQKITEFILDSSIYNTTWSPDANYFYTANIQSTGNDIFYQINIKTGEIKKLDYSTQEQINESLNLIALPDNHSLLFTVGPLLYKLIF